MTITASTTDRVVVDKVGQVVPLQGYNTTTSNFETIGVVNGAVPVTISASSVLPPENSIYSDTINLVQAAGNVVSAGDVSMFSKGILQITAINAADSIAITGYLDSALTKETGPILLFTTANVATPATALAAVGTYYVRDISFHALKITKTGSTAVASVEISLKA